MDQWGEDEQEEVAVEPQRPSSFDVVWLPDLAAVLLALAALLIALYPAWGKGWMPVRGDALSYFWPLREALSAALREGALPYYEFTNNGGTPLWINPQTQSFYPPSRLYNFVPVPQAMGILHASHLLLLFGGTVAMLRRLDYRYATASLAALCVALGGTFLSISPMQDKAHTAAWIPLMLWAGLSISRRSLLPRLVLAGATAMAVLAGGLDIVVLGILVTIFAASVASAPEPEAPEEEEEEEEKEEEEEDFDAGQRDEPKEAEATDFTPLIRTQNEGAQEGADEGALEPGRSVLDAFTGRVSEAGGDCLRAGLWIGIGLGLCAIQWLPFRAWIETSNWGEPLQLAELSARSLRFADLLGLVAPNIAYDAANSEYRLPGIAEAQSVYLPGLYAGGVAILLSSVGICHSTWSHLRQPRERWLLPGPVIAATLASLLCVLMAAGPAIAPIGWIETHMPVLSSIRYPEKWLLPAAILAAVPIAEGARFLASPKTPNQVLLRIGGFALVLAIAVTVLGMMTGEGDLDRGLGLARTALFTGLAACLAWWLLSLQGRPGLAVLGVAAAIVITGLDLSAHNLPLAPLADPSGIVRPPVAVSRILRSADKQRRSSGTLLPRRARIYQASYALHDKDPIAPDEAPLHEVLREALLGGIASVWGIEVMREWLVMAPSGLEKWYEQRVLKLPLARQLEGLRLAGITHIVVHFYDDATELVPLVGRGLEEVYSPEGTWTQMVIFALTDPLPSCRWTPLGQPEHDGLPIVPDEDAGGVWRGRVAAGKGLIVCLRPWDPAWHAELNGTRVDTQIVNDFQLAIPVPAGAHEVRMEYRPRAMRAARNLGRLSMAVLLVLIGLSLMRARKEASATRRGGDSESILKQEDQDEQFSDEAAADDAY